MKKIFKFFSSLKLAVCVLVALAIALAAGTIVESTRDMQTGQYWVYRSLWFQGLLLLLGINIFTVALSRWPWKKKHVAFLTAHLGILTLLAGSLLTQKKGLDANMMISEGESSAAVILNDTVILAREVGGSVLERKIISWQPPEASFQPVPLPVSGIVVDQYLTHAEAEHEFFSSPENPGAGSAAAPAEMDSVAVQLRIQAPQLGMHREIWLWSKNPEWTRASIGPLEISLADEKIARAKDKIRAELNTELRSTLDLTFKRTKNNLQLSVRSRSRTGEKKSSVPTTFEDPWLIPTHFQTGMMGGLKIWIVKVVDRASHVTHWSRSRTQYGNSAPPSAIRARLGSQDLWLGQDEKGFLEDGGRKWELQYFSLQNILPFELELERFEVVYDPGTQNAASYSSRVRVKARSAPQEPIIISMNEPLDFGDYTFYQSSFIPEDPRPRTTVLTVNYDPGRWLKYIGSILIVCGSILLFVQKWRKRGALADAPHS